MTYKEYASRVRRLKAEQKTLDESYIKEYPQRGLFGKVVAVRYLFRGRIHSATGFFEGIEPFFHDVIPIIKYLRQDGKPSRTRLANIYSMKQIVDIVEINKGKPLDAGIEKDITMEKKIKN